MSGAVVSLKAHGFFDCMRRWWNLFEMAQAYARDLPLIAVATVRSHRTGSQTPTCFKIEESFGHVWGGKTDMIHGFWGPMDGHKARSFWTCSYQVIPYAMFQFDFNLQSGRMRGKTQSDHGKLTSLQRKFLIPLLVPLGCFNADLCACVWCLSNRSSYLAKRIHQTYLALHTQFHGGFVWFGILGTLSPFTGCFSFPHSSVIRWIRQGC